MTEKRYIRNIVGQIYDIEKDKFYDEDYAGKPIGYEDEVVKLLNKQDKQIKETKDAFYEAHKQQQDCLKEVLKLQDEKRELEFKLNTLKKAYACQNCAFNDREMRYLKSLRE